MSLKVQSWLQIWTQVETLFCFSQLLQPGNVISMHWPSYWKGYLSRRSTPSIPSKMRKKIRVNKLRLNYFYINHLHYISLSLLVDWTVLYEWFDRTVTAALSIHLITVSSLVRFYIATYSPFFMFWEKFAFSDLFVRTVPLRKVYKHKLILKYIASIFIEEFYMCWWRRNIF